jgi:hypothetical protein
MKKYLWYGLAIVGMFSCKSSGIDKKDTGLKYKETRILNDVPRASLTFFEIEDSRCAEGANCIWAGHAVVDLLLSGLTVEGGVKEHIKMCLGDCGGSFGPDTLIKKFAGEEYQFILEEVNPYPKITEEHQKEAYSILLKIEKK